MIQRHTRVNLLIGTGHFLSHFYLLLIPPLFLIWQREFNVSYAELGLAVALMSGITAVLQTPVGFLVDRHGARPYLVGGALLMSLSIGAMGFAVAARRGGLAEAVLCEPKTVEQVRAIALDLRERGARTLFTRVTPEQADALATAAREHGIELVGPALD